MAIYVENKTVLREKSSFPFLVEVSVIACNVLCISVLTTDTPVVGCRWVRRIILMGAFVENRRLRQFLSCLRRDFL